MHCASNKIYPLWSQQYLKPQKCQNNIRRQQKCMFWTSIQFYWFVAQVYQEHWTLLVLTEPNISFYLFWLLWITCNTARLWKCIKNNMFHKSSTQTSNRIRYSATTNILGPFEGTPPWWHFVPATKLFPTHNCRGHKGAWFSPTLSTPGQTQTTALNKCGDK